VVVPAGASWNSEMVWRVRFQNRIGRSAANAIDVVTMSPNMAQLILFIFPPAALP
jgi:hypothetical protein